MIMDFLRGSLAVVRLAIHSNSELRLSIKYSYICYLDSGIYKIEPAIRKSADEDLLIHGRGLYMLDWTGFRYQKSRY
jgi:hypothetical protein